MDYDIHLKKGFLNIALRQCISWSFVRWPLGFFFKLDVFLQCIFIIQLVSIVYEYTLYKFNILRVFFEDLEFIF